MTDDALAVDESWREHQRRSGQGRSTTRGLTRRWSMVLLHLAVVGVGIGLVATSDLDTRPNIGERACARLLPDDDLVHLSLRRESDQARNQLARWDACDPGARDRAKDALVRDRWLIATIAAGLGLAVARTWRDIRWRLAAHLAALLTAGYLWGDIQENLALTRCLDNSDAWPRVLPWAAAVKFGALLGALPMFLVSLTRAVSDGIVARERTRTTRPGRFGAGRFLGRWRRRIATMFGAPPRTVPSVEFADQAEAAGGDEQQQGAAPAKPEMGICCSGGGIRSAAFNLGALQALDARGEVSKAKLMTAVSGGSYMAGAWKTGRAIHADAWARLSPEEQHLRRHSSYLAPGLGGKLWALTRFLLGFTMNIGLVGLALLVLFLPFGWLMDTWEQAVPAAGGGIIDLPSGGCLQLRSGRTVTVLPTSDLRLSRGQRAILDPGAPAIEAGAGGKGATASVTITTGDDQVVDASVSGAGTATGTVDLEDGRQATGTASIGDSTSTSTTSTTPTSPPTPTCPLQAVRPPVSGQPAAADGRRLVAGTKVRLELRRPLEVQGAGVSGCAAATTSTTALSCTPAEATVFGTPKGTRLMQAPEVFLTLPGSAIVSADQRISKACGGHACDEPVLPEGLLWTVRGVALAALALGLATIAVRTRPQINKRTEPFLKFLVSLALLLFFVFSVLPRLVVWAENGRWWLEDRAVVVSGGGTLAVLLALLAQVRPFLGSGSKAEPEGDGAVTEWLKKLSKSLRPLLVRFVGAVVGPILVLAAAVGIASYASQQGWQNNIQLLIEIASVGWLGAILAGADLNEWSLHPFYRDRLRSAFAVDPRQVPPGDPRDDPLQDLAASDPQLLICAAINIADEHVTAPGRPVASWTFSRERIGSDALTAAPSAVAASTDGVVATTDMPERWKHLAWAWTAVAVSGAAFSPAMGKMNRPERFLLALGNLRLGLWYPNPRYLADPAEAGWYDRHHPRPWYLVKEALGLHKADDRWVYLTDGGHYENLGLVELLRNGCREIYCFDAAGDRPDSFGTLADAARLAREEIGAEIAIDPTWLKPGTEDQSTIAVWAGTIRYAGEAAPSGWIVLAKLAVPTQAPFDIIDLARTLPAFPGNPTADQLYTDQKFEAYRALGHYMSDQATQLAADIRGLIASHGLGDAVKLATQAWWTAAKAARAAKAKALDEKEGDDD